MNALDYFQNKDILDYMSSAMRHIRNSEDREDCRQEMFAELYDFMPLDLEESKRVINRVVTRFRRGVERYSNETGYDEAGIE